MGRKELYDQLGDFSEADALKQLEWRRESVAGMKAQIDPAKLNDDAKTSWAIWELELDAVGAAAASGCGTTTSSALAGRTPDLPNFLITYHKVDEPADMDAYVARLDEAGRGDRPDRPSGRSWRRPMAFARRSSAMSARLSEAKNVITGAPFGGGRGLAAVGGCQDQDRRRCRRRARPTPEQATAWMAAAQAALTDAGEAGLRAADRVAEGGHGECASRARSAR